jgi:hypothetical protein
VYSVDRVRLELGLVCLSDQQTIKLFRGVKRDWTQNLKSLKSLQDSTGRKGFLSICLPRPAARRRRLSHGLQRLHTFEIPQVRYGPVKVQLYALQGAAGTLGPDRHNHDLKS